MSKEVVLHGFWSQYALICLGLSKWQHYKVRQSSLNVDNEWIFVFGWTYPLITLNRFIFSSDKTTKPQSKIVSIWKTADFSQNIFPVLKWHTHTHVAQVIVEYSIVTLTSALWWLIKSQYATKMLVNKQLVHGWYVHSYVMSHNHMTQLYKKSPDKQLCCT